MGGLSEAEAAPAQDPAWGSVAAACAATDRAPWHAMRGLRRLLLAARIVFALGLVFFVGRALDFAEVAGAWTQVRKGYLLAALVLLVPNVGLQALRWRGFVRLLKPEATFGESLRSLLAGFALGTATPGQLGEFGRVWYIPGGCSRWALAGLSFLDKYYTLSLVVVMGLLSLGSLPQVWSRFGPRLAGVGSGLLAALGMAMLVLLLSPRLLRGLVHRAQGRFPNRCALAQLSSALGGFTAGAAWRAMFWTLLFCGVFVIQFHLLVNGFAPHRFVDSARVVCGATLVKAVVPLTPGGLGVREVSAVELMKMAGGQPVAAFNASLLLFLNVLLPAVAGMGVVLTWGGKGRSRSGGASRSPGRSP